MAPKLPMRFRIIHYFSQVSDATLETLMEALREEYSGEGQFQRAIFEEHLMSLRAGGLIADRHLDLDAHGHLLQSFAITDLGRSRLHFLPAEWKSQPA